MWKYQNTDELYHYGIIGMKWGMRKAYATGKDYSYKSFGQKRHQKIVNKLTNKQIKKTDEGKRLNYTQDRKLKNSKVKLERLKERDKNREEYARSTSIGKSAIKTILFGPLGSGNYNRFRAAGHGRAVSALGANYISSTLGYPLTYMISRGSENRQAKRQVNYKNK